MEIETCRMPTLSISPNGITMYHTWIGKRKNHGDELIQARKDFERSKNLRKNNHNGELSDKAKKRIEAALKWLLFISKEKKIYHRAIHRFVKFKICFITLTLASKQKHDDNTIKSKLLNQLLTELRQTHGMKHYIWRAEKQANGNIHFHILTNVFIPQDSLLKKWNRIQNKLGYVDAYSERMRNTVESFSDYYNAFIGEGTYSQLQQRYIKGKACNWNNPNSTDIHSVRKVKNIAAYLTKYFTKSEQNSGAKNEDKEKEEKIIGKIWGLSETLSKLKTITTGIDNELNEELNRIYEAMKEKAFVDKYFTFIRISFKELIKIKAIKIMNVVFRELKLLNENSISLCLN